MGTRLIGRRARRTAGDSWFPAGPCGDTVRRLVPGEGNRDVGAAAIRSVAPLAAKGVHRRQETFEPGAVFPDREAILRVFEDCPEELAQRAGDAASGARLAAARRALETVVAPPACQAIDPIVSYPAPPPAPTVVHANPVPTYLAAPRWIFVPPWKGGTWRHTPAAGVAYGGRAIAARETRTPPVRVSLAQRLLRLSSSGAGAKSARPPSPQAIRSRPCSRADWSPATPLRCSRHRSRPHRRFRWRPPFPSSSGPGRRRSGSSCRPWYRS